MSEPPTQNRCFPLHTYFLGCQAPSYPYGDLHLRTTGRNVFLESFFSFVIWMLASSLELRGHRTEKFVFNLLCFYNQVYRFVFKMSGKHKLLPLGQKGLTCRMLTSWAGLLPALGRNAPKPVGCRQWSPQGV